jgi:hypothetical protein
MQRCFGFEQNAIIPRGRTPPRENCMNEKKQDDWRELCAEAAAEPDPERLALLVDQIIHAMEQARRRAADCVAQTAL